jgi:hypothetical protein
MNSEEAIWQRRCLSFLHVRFRLHVSERSHTERLETLYWATLNKQGLPHQV